MTASIARKSVTVAEYSLPSGERERRDGEKSNKKKRWRWRGQKIEDGAVKEDNNKQRR